MSRQPRPAHIQRKNRMSVNFTKAEANEVERKAWAAGQTIAEYLRTAALTRRVEDKEATR